MFNMVDSLFHLLGIPRVSGDEPLWEAIITSMHWYSPRERG